jgi:hypothetical protein
VACTIIYKSIIYIYFGRAGRITQNKLERVLSLRASRLWRSVPNAPAVAFDRTAALYHVKADWPHQDTRGNIKPTLIILEDNIYEHPQP